MSSNISDPMLLDETGLEIEEALLQLAGEYDLTDYKSIVKAIRRGDAAKIPNGLVFSVPHAVYGNMDFIVRRHDVEKVAGDPDRPTVTIQSKYLISANAGTTAATFQYDRPEAMFPALAEAIPQGTVVQFTATAYGGWTAGTYHFTASVDLPVGTMLCLNGYQNTALTSLKVAAYATQKDTTALASMTIESGAGDATVNLGTWQTEGNHPQRISYGSNNDMESNLFQFLNGDSGDGYMSSIWTPKTKFDMMSSFMNSTKGFLGGFPEDFRACLAMAKIHNITNDVYESPDSAYAKSQECYYNGYFWLPSRKEFYGSNENAREASETQFEYFATLGTRDADKLMYAKGASGATTYWLRTPLASFASYVRGCNTGYGGALNGYGAHNSYGVAPLAILA